MKKIVKVFLIGAQKEKRKMTKNGRGETFS